MYAVDRGTDTTYEEARSAIEAILGKAEKYFQKLGSDLKASADQYEADDQKAQDGIQSVQ